MIREKCSQALNILDRPHIMAKMNKTLEAVRVGESRKLAPAGTPAAVEKNRWCRDHHQGTVDGSLPVPKFAQAHRRVPEPTPRDRQQCENQADSQGDI